ncbi:MFS transporter [Prauserella cavernicola]|uniref:MFS transporter n=1 Tax=Prauserella cavernicola TaxID=2800127 RepID=A0A934QTK4_9PSEU|nr:MFS transporter [Prauserella cavernicola]MBK1786260.1 MFS transporter [Prauserella cavernicola]
MPVWLFGLLFAAFVLFTDDYVIAGVLPEIAADLGVSVGAAGQLVTVFSITVAVGAPIAAVVVARWPRRRVFVIALPLFVAANALAAVTPSFGVLLGLRVLAAIAAAMSTPALFAAAAKLAPEGKQGRFLGIVGLGVTGSIAVGVPVGTWIGGEVGWRATFATMAGAGVVALVWLLATLPRSGPDPAVPLRDQVAVLVSRPVALALLGSAVLITGSMMLLTYLAPFLAGLGDASIEARAMIFAASGVAGMIGILLGGIATDRWGAGRTLALGVAVFVAIMVVLALLWLVRPVPLWVVAPLAVVWAGAAFWTSSPVRDRLLRIAGPVGPQALGMNTSANYVGVALGGALGGGLLSLGAGSLPVVSAVLGVVALGLFRLAASAPVHSASRA